MNLALLTYFNVRDDWAKALVEQILREQMDDGGWNCARRRRGAQHSSLHTTINILDGLADYAQSRGGRAVQRVRQAMARAQEFMLQHHLFRSDKTGEVIREAFMEFSFPPRWHYDVLRALEHFQRMNAPRDRACKTPSIWCCPSNALTAAGNWRTITRARNSSGWKSKASPAAGTPYEPCGFCDGGTECKGLRKMCALIFSYAPLQID
jgi:hypothetical protein